MKNSGELRKQVLSLIDSAGKHGAKSKIGRAAEDQNWEQLLKIWAEVGDAKAISLLIKDKLEEEKEG